MSLGDILKKLFVESSESKQEREEDEIITSLYEHGNFLAMGGCPAILIVLKCEPSGNF